MCLFSAASISTGQILGWGSKAIEIRSAETGHLDGVFMHVKDQKLKFLCERNYKVGHLSCLTFAFCRWSGAARKSEVLDGEWSLWSLVNTGK